MLLIFYKLTGKKIVLMFLLITTHGLFAQSMRNDSLIRQLAAIMEADQLPRMQLNTIQHKYASDTAQLRMQLARQFRLMKEGDSVNLIKVTSIIDRHGWLGADAIGADGNSTLFLVIQHTDLPIHQKYLPVMREAVKKGHAKAGSLALLEDRVALGEGRRQTYGSQIGWNMLTNTYQVLPLDDPDNADKRRASVGLPPLAEYLSYWNIKWDTAQYKKDRPSLDTLYHVKTP